MHGEDVRGPLGLARDYPQETVLRALGDLSGPGVGQLERAVTY